ncbi:hypothetical protein JD844_024626, partial [Phrynosoma platyrhinos]
ESIKIKVNMLGDHGNIQEEQVVLNITYINGQVYVNDFPLRTGVARIKCQTLILGSGNTGSDEQRLGTVSVRVMIHAWPMASSSNLQLIVVQEEVTEIDGKEVQQDEVTEIDILVKDVQVLRHTNYTVPLKESMLYSIPRDNDVLFTLPNIAGKADIESPLQTTSHYLLRQVETTIDEETMHGKLPETPLRTDPPSSYKPLTMQGEKSVPLDFRTPYFPARIALSPNRGSLLFQVMCQWVENLRKELCKFWLKSFPVFFNFMEVVVVGVIGAALILKVLTFFCPTCEPSIGSQKPLGINYKSSRELLLDVNIIPVTAISLLPEMPEKTDITEEKCI